MPGWIRFASVHRWVLLGLPLAALCLALVEFASRELLGIPPAAGPLAASWKRLAFEAAALLVLFAWLEERFRSWLWQGLAVGLLAWLFRGPLFALLVAESFPSVRGVSGAELLTALLADVTAAWGLALLSRALRRTAGG